MKSNKNKIKKNLTIEIPKLKEELLKGIDNEKTRIFNYKLFEENIKQEAIKTEKIKKDYKRLFKIIIPISLIMIIVIVLSISTSYALSDKLDEYSDEVVEFDKKIDTTVKIYQENNKQNTNVSNIAANNLVNCINSKIDTNNVPENIQKVINKINDYYNESNNHFAFAYEDLYTGFKVTYNETQQVFTASTIKAPTDLYIYEMASQGKVNLDEEVTYTSNYYNPKSGKLKYNPFNTKYTVRELLRLSTVYSDNAAHNMLEDKFGRVNMLNFWKEKGTEYIFTQNSNWGVLNAHDALIYMEELYNFYLNNKEYGNEIMENFKNASPKFIEGKNNYAVANKSGWGSTSIHDVSIIFAENPYIVVALSTLGLTEIYNSYFDKVNDLAYELHTEYWKYKTESCNNIKQYN